MKYCYKCKYCGEFGCVEWENRTQSFNCHNCKKNHIPPNVKVDHDAYVDQHDWTEEMKEEVIRIHGKNCIVPWCSKTADTLDHILAWDNGGKTSVNNLQPMCKQHNSSKGNINYRNWLKEIENDPKLGRKSI